MKRNVFLSILSMLLFIACNNDKKTTEAAPAEPQLKTATQPDPKAEKLAALQKATATDLDQLQKLIPAEMAGIKRTRLNMNSNIGYSIVQADFQKNSKTDIRMIAYDCAGEQGAKLYNNSFLAYLDKNENNAEDYTKTIGRRLNFQLTMIMLKEGHASLIKMERFVQLDIWLQKLQALKRHKK